MSGGPSARQRRVNERGAIRYHGRSDASAVYRIYNAADELIYIGMSYEPAVRARVQRREKAWGHEIDRYEVDWHPNRATSQRAEEELIKEFRPRYNVVHTPAHKVRSLEYISRARAQQIAEGRTTGKRAEAPKRQASE
jgi:GIY-YIG catalytic domain.